MREESAGWGADAVFVLPYAASAFETAVEAARPGGTRRPLFAGPAGDALEPRAAHGVPPRPFAPLLVLLRRRGAEARDVALIASGVVRADRIVTHRVPLAEAPEAFRLARARGDVLKVMVTNGG